MIPLLIPHPLLGWLVSIGLFSFLFAGTRLFQVLRKPSPESVRKLFHLGGALISLSLPWLFDALWTDLVAVGAGVALFAAVRWLPVLNRSWGRILGAVDRPTYGEFWFLAAVLCLLLFSGRSLLLYSVPLIVLTFADPSAALVGALYGRLHYRTFRGGRKSVEGSIAFFLVSFLSILVPQLAAFPGAQAASLLRALAIASAVTLAEAVCGAGVDNAVVPLVCFLLLKVSLDAPATGLLASLVATAALGILVWLLQRRRADGPPARTVRAGGSTEGTSRNIVSLLQERIRERPADTVLWTRRRGALSFGEFGRLVTAAQAALTEARIGVGDMVMLVLLPGAQLYAWGTAVLAQGATVLAVEPWLGAASVASVLAAVMPAAFVYDGPGWLWGAVHRAVRRIPRRLEASLAPASTAGFGVEDVPSDRPAVVTFTSGTTGVPRGVVRTHGLLSATRRILDRHTGSVDLQGPDLCIFPSFAILNIAAGRPSILVSPWQRASLSFLDRLPPDLAPQSMTVGPRFLERILRECRLPSLRHVNVGGAPTDCVSVEEGIRRFPHARINWLYGSSEAEPICVTGARKAAAASRARGLVQVLWLGRPVPEIRLSPSAEGLWVSGPHVSGVYLASPEANARFKRTDPSGTTWHNTGDRVMAYPPWAARADGSPAGASAPVGPPASEADGGLWYAGRASQPLDDFWIEQRLYAALGHSRAFVMRHRDGSLRAYGMGIAERAVAVRSAVPEIDSCSDISALRYDPRHRSRIRREESLGRRRG